MYINKETGDKISTEDMQKYADENGVSVEEHAANFGYTLEGQPEDFQSLLIPYPAESMQAYPVSTFVNSPKNNSPQCIQGSTLI